MRINNISRDETILKKLAEVNKFIIIAFVSKEYNEIAYNWFLHLKKHKHDTHSLLICLDQDSFAFAKEKNIPSIYVDQEKTVSSIKENPFKNAWKLSFHICQALVIEYITQKFNVDLIQTDVDMCVLKEKFVEQIYLEVVDGFDTCVYTNTHYNNLNTLEESASKNGGMILLWTPKFVKKFIENIQNSSELILDAPSTKTTLEKIGDTFKIYGKKLHPIFFTNTTYWIVDDIRKYLQHISFVVHYNMLRDVTVLNTKGLEDLVSLKISLMKLHGHWLVSGGQSRIRTHGEVSPTSDFKSDALDQLSHLPI